MSADAHAAVVTSLAPSPIRRTFRSSVLVVVAAEALTAGAPTIPARVATEIAIASAGLRNTGGPALCFA